MEFIYKNIRIDTLLTLPLLFIYTFTPITIGITVNLMLYSFLHFPARSKSFSIFPLLWF